MEKRWSFGLDSPAEQKGAIFLLVYGHKGDIEDGPALEIVLII